MKAVIVLVSLTVNLMFFAQLLCGKNSSEIHNVYKKIGAELINLRKEFSATQPKVYSLLDQVDKMYTLTQTAQQKKTVYRQKYKESVQLGAAAQQENIILQAQVKTLESKLLLVSKKLEEEKQLREYIAKAYQEKPVTAPTPIIKQDPIMDDQSLSRTSTSDPISPR
jgi:hypothetical protein